MSVGVTLALLAAASQARVSLADIRMQLFYEGSGRLSPDLTQQPDFAGWNVIIGEGSAEEPANDLLVSVELRSPVEKHIETPLKIVAKDAKGKVLGSREIRSILISDSGRSLSPLWLQNVGCAGKITVSVQFGRQRRTENLELQCGE